MPETTIISKQASNSLTTLEDKARQLDVAADKFSVAFENSKTPFTSALALSNGIKALRELLDDGIMREIMNLADTPLGFLTDRGPSVKGRDGRPVEPYKLNDVRDAIIEASLRGFRVAGNEFNIISSRFYAAKAGLHRKIVSYPGVTDFKEFLGIPKLSGERGAIVSAKATWIKDNIRCELSRDFAIRVNAAMGVDAILGKCQRKLYAAVLNRLSGIVTPEGEIDDAPIRAEDVASKPAFNGTAHQAPELEEFTGGSGDTKEKAKPLGEHWRDILARFAKLGVTTDDLLNFLELEHEGEITPQDCETLRRVYTDIEEKRSTIEGLFPQSGDKPRTAQPRGQEDFLSGVGDSKEATKAKK